jgi:hypothetical protein
VGDDVKIDLKEISEGTEWIHLAQYMDKWWALVDTVILFRFVKGGSIS